jgi:Uma2 family endonuclease
METIMALATKLITAEELLAMPTPEGMLTELIDGEIKTMSPAGSDHSRIAMLVGISLGTHVKTRGLGVVYGADGGFILRRNPDTVRSPDAAFVSRERFVQTTSYFPGPPDLAVEVISPSDTYTEVDAKVLDYLRSGVRLVIVIDPSKQSAAMHRSMTETQRIDADGALDGGDVVPGWTLPLRELFA